MQRELWRFVLGKLSFDAAREGQNKMNLKAKRKRRKGGGGDRRPGSQGGLSVFVWARGPVRAVNGR